MKKKNYIYNLLTTKNKLLLHITAILKRPYLKYNQFSKEQVLKTLTRFHQSITFSDEDNYLEIVKEEYKDYLADKTKYYQNLMEVLNDTIHQRVTGEFFKNEYYLKCLKFEEYEYINKEVKEEYKPFIKAGNSGIYGRLPIMKNKEKEIVNEAFRLLLSHYSEYYGGSRTEYMDKERYPYEYIGKEGVIQLYNQILTKK